MRPKRLHQAVADIFQISFNGGAIIVVENESFGADGGALYHHAAAAGNEKRRLVRSLEPVGKRHGAVLDSCEFADFLTDD